MDDSRCAGSLAGDFTIVLFHRFAASLATPEELVPVIMGSCIDAHDFFLWALVCGAFEFCFLGLLFAIRR